MKGEHNEKKFKSSCKRTKETKFTNQSKKLDWNAQSNNRRSKKSIALKI